MKTINILIISLFLFTINQVKGQNIKVGDFLEFTLPVDGKIITYDEFSIEAKKINDIVASNANGYIYYKTNNLIVNVQPILNSKIKITDIYNDIIKSNFTNLPNYSKTIRIQNKDKNSFLFFEDLFVNLAGNNQYNKGFAMHIRYKNEEDKQDALNERDRFLKSLKFKE